MRRRRLGIADRIALIALGGISASAAIWLAYAFVAGVLFNGSEFSAEVFNPSSQDAWNRLVAIVAVLIATLVIQTITARRLQVEHELDIERNRTKEMYENSPDSVVCLDAKGDVLYGNLRAEQLTGVTVTADGSTRCFEAMYGRTKPCPDCDLDEVVRTGQVRSRTETETMSDGDERWFSTLLYPIRDSRGSVVSVVETARDVTDLHRAEDALRENRIEKQTAELRAVNARLRGEVAERMAAALRESEERYRRLIEHSPDMILVHKDEKVAFVNPAGVRLMGAGSAEDAIGQGVLSLWVPNGSGLTAIQLKRTIVDGAVAGPIPVRLKRLDGELVDVEVTVSRLVLDGENFVQCVARDITERLRADETIKRMAFYDGLTGLPNRTLFSDRLLSAIARAKRENSVVAVAFLDLDDFKAINDTLGHGVGDEMLRAVGQRIAGFLRDNDTIARHSGDEFTIIAEVEKPEDVAALAERILDGLRPVFHIAGHDLHVTASLGIALYPEHGVDELELLKHADTAMYRAKEHGQCQYRVYKPDMGKAARDRLQLETELRRAIEEHEFELYYQPQVNLGTGAVIGVEALLRWNHPERGVVRPDAFLHVAEQAGLISHMGRWVLAEACTQTRAWLDSGVNIPRVAVNLSAREFLQRDVVEVVRETLAGTGLPGSMLELEITESVAIRNLEKVLNTLSRLRALDVRIAIDDFGTGYSSMSYLQRFPVQTLKIAQTFMQRVDVDAQSAAIASLLVDLCRELDLDVVAEGVENERQRAFLADKGCLIVQGNLFCEPLPAPELAAFLAKGPVASARV